MFLDKKFEQQNSQTLDVQSKFVLYFTISHSKSILLISSNKIASFKLVPEPTARSAVRWY
jgi:hypothetical protein